MCHALVILFSSTPISSQILPIHIWLFLSVFFLFRRGFLLRCHSSWTSSRLGEPFVLLQVRSCLLLSSSTLAVVVNFYTLAYSRLPPPPRLPLPSQHYCFAVVHHCQIYLGLALSKPYQLDIPSDIQPKPY